MLTANTVTKKGTHTATRKSKPIRDDTRSPRGALRGLPGAVPGSLKVAATVDHFESIELLESTHLFPSRFMIKVIGTTDDDFVGRTVEAVRQGLQASIDPPYRTRSTAGGRHVAVTFEPVVKSAEQVLAVYRCIRDLQGLVLLL